MTAHVCVFTGAGISVASGLPCYRGGAGLWDGVSPDEVASPMAWQRDPHRVTRVHNQLRAALGRADPNEAHLALARLERMARVDIVTQNIDDLHERAGSTVVTHVHGALTRIRSDRDQNLVSRIGHDRVEPGARAPDGGLWRPDVVWFMEEPQRLEQAEVIIAACDELWIIGTSLSIWPAAALVHHARRAQRILLIDPDPCPPAINQLQIIAEPAVEAVPRLVGEIMRSGG